MRFYGCVIFDAIIRNEKTQRILSESTLTIIFIYNYNRNNKDILYSNCIVNKLMEHNMSASDD